MILYMDLPISSPLIAKPTADCDPEEAKRLDLDLGMRHHCSLSTSIDRHRTLGDNVEITEKNTLAEKYIMPSKNHRLNSAFKGTAAHPMMLLQWRQCAQPTRR